MLQRLQGMAKDKVFGGVGTDGLDIGGPLVIRAAPFFSARARLFRR